MISICQATYICDVYTCSSQVQALQKTYVIDLTESPGAKMNFNLPGFRRALGCLRLLLKVGMGREEEQSLKNNLRSASLTWCTCAARVTVVSLCVHLSVSPPVPLLAATPFVSMYV